MKLPFIKIGSGDTNNFPLIEHIAMAKVPVILSTGMQNFETVRHAHELITKHHKELALLHCVSAYPTEPQDVNLAVLDLYRTEFPHTVIGYSGHEKGIHIALAAVARGAKVTRMLNNTKMFVV
jgi:sialic acid synthase